MKIRLSRLKRLISETMSSDVILPDGWTIKKTSDGYVAYDPNGEMFANSDVLEPLVMGIIRVHEKWMKYHSDAREKNLVPGGPPRHK